MRHDLKECGKRIQQLRKERELTQEQLAEKLNVSQNTIAKIESGLRRPSIDFLLEISFFFNVSTNYLVFGVHAEDVEDEKYRLLLNKEYQFCMKNAERIQKKANKIYEMVTSNRKQILTDNSCAFHILEDGCREYIEKYLRNASK